MKTVRCIAIAAMILPLQLLANGADTTSKTYFYAAKEHIENMLSGKEAMSYEKAIYEIENAWWEGGIDYSIFEKVLAYHTNNIAKLCAEYKDNERMHPKSDYSGTKEHKQINYERMLANFSIYKYMTTSSLWVKDDRLVYHKPYSYSVKDPMGTSDWTNTQVVNLLSENRGNCFALASLFKIFADRLNSDARLCTAPSHIYIRHADEKGTFYNVELASRAFPGTGTIETITYTPDEATKNNISLRELDTKQSIALCLVYLAKGFDYKFKVKDNDFALQCAQTALKYDDHNLNAMLLKAEVLENRLVRQQKDISQLQKQNDFQEYQAWIAHIFTLGYREMPFEMKNLLIKGWTRDTIIQLSTSDHTPKRLNNSTIEQTRYASLSWGLFDEEIKTKPLERYGNTVLNTENKKIVAFLHDDVLYNQYNFDPTVFALNIDPLAHKFPSQSPYSSFGDNPIFNVDVGGAYQYPAKLAAGYTKTYPMLTLYLAKYVQNDIRKSTTVQNAIVDNTHGGYTKNDLVNTVAAWGNKESPIITFDQGLTTRTGAASGWTPDSKHINIDADYAKTLDNMLSDNKTSAADKQGAITKFYETLIDETTHTGDMKKGYSTEGEVGGDARNAIFHTEKVKGDDGKTYPVDYSGVDVDVDDAGLNGVKGMIDRKTQTGQKDVLPTVPQKDNK